MPLYGDGRSGTFSTTVTQFGGYRSPASQAATPLPGASRLLSQPADVSSTPATAAGSITLGGTATGSSTAAYTGGAVINDGATTTTASLAVVIPVAAAVGNVAVVHIHGNLTVPGDDVTPPAGWTRITGPDPAVPTALNTGLIFAKTLASGEPGSTVTFTVNTARRVAGTITTYANVDLSGAHFALVGDTSADTTADLPTLTNVSNGSLVIALYGRRSAATTAVTSMTVPAAYTAGPESRTNIPTTINILSRAAYLLAGATGTYGGETTATTSPDTTVGVDYLLALPLTVAGSSAAVAAGTITLGGSVTGAAPAVATTGAITLGGTATGSSSSSAAASGAVTLGGAATAQAPASASGSISLGGSGTAQARASSTGAITLGGSSTAASTVSATGSLTLGGTATGRGGAVAGGTITLGGTVTSTGGPTAATAAGGITLGGNSTARVSATAAGLITLSGLANGQAADGLDTFHPHTYVTAVLTSNGTSTAVLAPVSASTATLTRPSGFGEAFGESFGGWQATVTATVTDASVTALLAGGGTATVTLAGNGTSTAELAEVPALAELQLV